MSYHEVARQARDLFALAVTQMRGFLSRQRRKDPWATEVAS